MKNKRTNSIAIIVIILIIIGWVIWFGYNLAPGSYPYGEQYTLQVNEEKLVNAINELKRTNPWLNPPSYTKLTDGRLGGDSLWYIAYFYYKDKNQILYVTTRPKGKNATIFTLVRINQGTQLGNWKDINSDFDNRENREQKRLFEERIIKKLKENLNLVNTKD